MSSVRARSIPTHTHTHSHSHNPSLYSQRHINILIHAAQVTERRQDQCQSASWGEGQHLSLIGSQKKKYYQHINILKGQFTPQNDNSVII